MSRVSSCGFKNVSDRHHHVVPVSHFFPQAPAPGSCQAIKAHWAALFRNSFLRDDPTLEFHAMKGWIERSLVDAQKVLGYLADALRDPPSVHRT